MRFNGRHLTIGCIILTRCAVSVNGEDITFVIFDSVGDYFDGWKETADKIDPFK